MGDELAWTLVFGRARHFVRARMSCAGGVRTPDLSERVHWVAAQSTWKKEIQLGAHNSAVGPQGPRGQGEQDQDACAQGFASASGRVHARVHNDPEEAELGAAEGRSCPAVLGSGG